MIIKKRDDITIHDFEICAALARHINNMLDHQERMRLIMEKCTTSYSDMPKTTRNVYDDKIAEGIDFIDNLDNEYREQIATYIDHVKIIEYHISTIQNDEQKMALRLRYVDGMEWELVGRKMHYNPRWCRELSYRGLESLGLRDKDSQPQPTEIV